jgi:hypothetical protein
MKAKLVVYLHDELREGPECEETSLSKTKLPIDRDCRTHRKVEQRRDQIRNLYTITVMGILEHQGTSTHGDKHFSEGDGLTGELRRATAKKTVAEMIASCHVFGSCPSPPSSPSTRATTRLPHRQVATNSTIFPPPLRVRPSLICVGSKKAEGGSAEEDEAESFKFWGIDSTPS